MRRRRCDYPYHSRLRLFVIAIYRHVPLMFEPVFGAFPSQADWRMTGGGGR